MQIAKNDVNRQCNVRKSTLQECALANIFFPICAVPHRPAWSYETVNNWYRQSLLYLQILNTKLN